MDDSLLYSNLYNSQGGGNKIGGGAKNVKSINLEEGINVNRVPKM